MPEQYDENGNPIPQSRSKVGGLASIAATGVFAARSVSNSFRTKTDDIAVKGLREASALSKALGKDFTAVADKARLAGENVVGMNRASELMGKSLAKTGSIFDNMAKAVPTLSSGFSKIGEGSIKMLTGMFASGGITGKLKAMAGGFKELALGIGMVARGAIVAIPALLPIIAIVAAIVAVVKLVQFTVKLFADEIKEMKAKALEPWGNALQKAGDALRRILAPAVAFVMLVIKGFFALVEAVGKVVGPLLEKMSSEGGGALDSLGDKWARWIEFMLEMIQPFVNGVVALINGVKIAFAIFHSNNMTTGEKWKMFGKLLIAVWFEAQKQIVNLLETTVKGLIELFENLINGILFVVINGLILITTPFRETFKKVLEGAQIFAGYLVKFFKDPIGTIVDLWNGMVDKAKQLGENIVKGLQEGWNKAKNVAGDVLNFLGLGGGSDDVRAGIISKGDEVVAQYKEMFADLNSAFVQGKMLSWEEFINSSFAVNFDSVKEGVTNVADFLRNTLQGFQDKFGIDLESMAKDLGIDLINAPDLVGEFRKLLAQAKIKIEDHNLNRHLDELGEKIDHVNDKDMNIEINPLIQLTVTKEVSAEYIEAILLPTIDKMLIEGANRLGNTVLSSNIGDA